MQGDFPFIGLILIQILSLFAGTLLGIIYTPLQRDTTCSSRHHDGLGTFEHGFTTEMIRTSLQITQRVLDVLTISHVVPSDLYEVSERRFTGRLEFHTDGSETLILPDSEPAYVGDPSPAIDAAWDHLVEGRYWSISEKEARMLWGVGYQQYRDQVKGGYTGG
jgi:hypothetical protein